MTQSDVLSELKKQVRAELNEAADKHIEKLVDKFRSELVRNKNSLIAGLINGIDILTNTNEIKNETTFQINIKAGRSEQNGVNL